MGVGGGDFEWGRREPEYEKSVFDRIIYGGEKKIKNIRGRGCRRLLALARVRNTTGEHCRRRRALRDCQRSSRAPIIRRRRYVSARAAAPGGRTVRFGLSGKDGNGVRNIIP